MCPCPTAAQACRSPSERGRCLRPRTRIPIPTAPLETSRTSRPARRRPARLTTMRCASARCCRAGLMEPRTLTPGTQGGPRARGRLLCDSHGLMLGKTETLAVLGCGTMGEAIVRGLLRSGKLEPTQIFATDRRAEVARALHEKHGVRTGSDNREACQGAAVVLVCVKPHEVEPLVADPALASVLAGKLVISIAAGVRLDQLAGWLPNSAVVRAMPNTPCLIGEGMTVIARGPGVSDEQAAV